jgi:hypothetical protein
MIPPDLWVLKAPAPARLPAETVTLLRDVHRFLTAKRGCKKLLERVEVAICGAGRAA